MKKYNKAIYVLILVLFCCGIMMGSYKNEKSIVYNRKEKDIFDFQLDTTGRYGIVYDTNDRNSYLVKIDTYGFDEDMYCLGKGTFYFEDYDYKSVRIFNEVKEYVINDTVTIEDSSQEIEELCRVKLSYNKDENYINVMSYKNNALCKIPIEQSAEYIIVDIIDLARYDNG